MSEAIDSTGRQMSKLPQEEFKVYSKIYPVPFVNSKGYRIGDYKIIVDTSKLPFNSVDQTNHYLYNLFDYVGEQGTPAVPNRPKRDIREFFVNKKDQLRVFTPIKYPDEGEKEFLEMEQELLKEENRKLRKNLRELKRRMEEITGENEKYPIVKQNLDREIEPIREDKKEKQKLLAAYLDAIEDIEDDMDKTKKGGRKTKSRNNSAASKKHRKRKKQKNMRKTCKNKKK